jgi:hypothetical protein
MARLAALWILRGVVEWSAPEPGSYELPPIQRVREWRLLDPERRETAFPALASAW